MYSDIIKRSTGCNDADAEHIEDIMRDVIFHSTLDWQTGEELAAAALLAQQVFRAQEVQPQ